MHGNDPTKLKLFSAETRVEKALKEVGQGSHKIELSKKDQENRDKNQQSIYHTGNLIKIEAEDQNEIQSNLLMKIAEGERESSNEGDEDDYGDEDPDEDITKF